MTFRRAVGTLVLLATTSGGCVYFNSLYNARERFAAGEEARRAGDAETARVAYDDAVRKAARGFRSDPEGRWADDALFIMGRAWFRTGELSRSMQALEEARMRTDDPDIRRGATLYLGAARTRLGEGLPALELLNEAMRGISPGTLAAEGHFWRGVLHMELGRRAQGLWDLERAAEVDDAFRVPALLHRGARGVVVGDTAMLGVAVRGLASAPGGAAQADSLEALIRRLARQRGPAAAGRALAPMRGAAWSPGPRDALILQRARLLAEAGQLDAAREEAGWLAEGSGQRSAEARLALARWRLAEIREVPSLGEVRDLLLPAAGEPEVVRLAEGIRTVELLEGWGGEHGALAHFAAAEVSRDVLNAPALARSLFLRYAAERPEGPWAAKAILAALATTPDATADGELRRGLETRTSDPYVAQARTGRVGSQRMQLLEARLARELDDLLSRAVTEARRRDLFLRTADTLGPAPEVPTVPPIAPPT